MNSLKNISKIAGIGYLFIFVTGIFSNFFILENLIVPGDALATVNNITDHNSLYRIGILSFILMVVWDVVLAWALYILLKPVDGNLSLLSGWLRLVNSTIFGVALFNLFNILKIVSDVGFLNVLGKDFISAQVMLYLETFNDTWLIGLIFFGFHLFVLGYLIFRSGFMPKFLGILLIFAAVGYLTDSFASFLLPDYAVYKDFFLLMVVVPGIIGELSLTFWLLFKSHKFPELKNSV